MQAKIDAFDDKVSSVVSGFFIANQKLGIVTKASATFFTKFVSVL